MPVAPAPYVPSHFLDNNNVPLNGGQLFTYAAGTMTKQATYVDSSQTTQNTNPIILNSRGEATVWLDVTKTYKFILAPANDTDPPTAAIWTEDNISGTAWSGGVSAGTVTGSRAVLAAITGAVTGQAAILTEALREGNFVFSSANQSAGVTADPNQGIYVAPVSDPTGASGAWIRKYDGPYQARWWGVIADNSTDNTATAQAAINAVSALGGGELRFPTGVTKHAGLIFKNKIQYRGSGHDTNTTTGTVLLYTGSGDGVQINNPINSSTAANVSVEGIAFKNQNVNAGKGCFADTGSTDLKFHRCGFSGSDRGLIFDQSELADVIECDFEGVTSQTCLLWLVNGADRTPGALGIFTNRISVQRCQFNAGTTTKLIVTDGGTAHTFVDNNYNGGSNHVRAAGVNGLTFKGGEWESATGPNIVLASTSLAGTGSGAASPVTFEGAPVIIPTTGQPCVSISAAGTIVFNAPFFGNSTSQKVVGCINANSIFSFGAQNGGGGALFDGLATNHFQVDNGGAIVTNLGGLTIPSGGQLTFVDSGGSTYQSFEQHDAVSPFRYHTIASQGGAGGWQGGFRVRVNYNAGSLFDGFKVQANTDGVTSTTVLGGPLNIPEIAAANVTTPPAATQSLFIDTADHKLKRKDSSGTVTVIA